MSNHSCFHYLSKTRFQFSLWPFRFLPPAIWLKPVKINHVNVILSGILGTSSNLKEHIKNFRQTTIVNFSNPFFKYLTQRKLLKSIESQIWPVPRFHLILSLDFFNLFILELGVFRIFLSRDKIKHHDLEDVWRLHSPAWGRHQLNSIFLKVIEIR